MQLGFYYNQTRCVGCYTCAVACKDWHDIPAGRASWMKVTCIEEGKFPDVFVSYLTRPCYHCEEPTCVESCPSDAITKRAEDGIVVVDREACLGETDCGACLECRLQGGFECGMGFECKGGVVYGEWHEHHMNGDIEEIHMFYCTSACQDGVCAEQWYDGSPHSGGAIVAELCGEEERWSP